MALRALVPGLLASGLRAFGGLTTSVAIPQHADQHGPERPVLLAVA